LEREVKKEEEKLKKRLQEQKLKIEDQMQQELKDWREEAKERN